MNIEVRGALQEVPPTPKILHDDHYNVDVYPATCTNAVMDIMVPAHSRVDLTMTCVKSIYSFTQAPFHLLILDDAPPDDYGMTEKYITELQKEYNNITYCHSNIPFKCGSTFFNVGLKYSLTNIYVTIMNSMTVEPAWETVALQLMENDPQIGSIGFKCLFPNGLIESASITFVGHIPTDYGRDAPGYRCNEIREVEAVQWAFAMHRKQALVGNLDEDIFNGHVGWDDIDNNFVLKSKGWKILYCGQGAGVHQPRATRGSNSVEAALRNQENAQVFYKRWGYWNQYIEGSKMNVAEILKYETKAMLSERITKIQVIRGLLKEAEDGMQGLVNQALNELHVEPNKYLLEMNPSTNTWLLKINSAAPQIEEPTAIAKPAGDTEPGDLEMTVEVIKA